MTRETAGELVTEVLARHCGIDKRAIALDSRVQDDLGLDSVDASELLIVIEQKTGCRLDLESFEDIETVGGIVARLEAAGDKLEVVGDGGS